MAILNSGLSMKFLIAAIHCIVTDEGQIILDPDHRQTEKSIGQLTFAYNSADRRTVAIHTSGRYSAPQYSEALIMCRIASGRIFDYYKNSVRKVAKVL